MTYSGTSVFSFLSPLWIGGAGGLWNISVRGRLVQGQSMMQASKRTYFGRTGYPAEVVTKTSQASIRSLQTEPTPVVDLILGHECGTLSF